jgi:predicted O-methyltransferase YrrM
MSNKKRNQKAAREARKTRRKDAAAEAIRPQVEQNMKPYAENWSKHADHFRSLGYYDWMADFRKQFHRILEIGTGEGSGTIALYHNGSTVVSVDHNPICQDIAEARMASERIPMTRERRGRLNAFGKGYRMTYSYRSHRVKLTVVESCL